MLALHAGCPTCAHLAPRPQAQRSVTCAARRSAGEASRQALELMAYLESCWPNLACTRELPTSGARGVSSDKHVQHDLKLAGLSHLKLSQSPLHAGCVSRPAHS